MHLIHRAAELNPAGRRLCVAIGVFDGVHLGHQQVIRQAVADAARCEGVPAVLTFDRHPNRVVAPERAPRMIQSLPQKLRAFAALGVEVTVLFQFDERFSRQPGEEFIRGLARECGGLGSLCVGAEFVFGHRRSGDVALLRRLGDELGFVVHGLSGVALDGQVVSSTRIRDAIQAGDFDAAGQMLGHPYALAGTVVAGDQLGRKLGFPTANLDVRDLELPPRGVYAVHARLDHQWLRALLNLGVRPTVSGVSSETRAEVHLLDFDADLYGREIEVTFVKNLRAEQRFPSVEALRAQIARDLEVARALFGAGPLLVGQ